MVCFMALQLTACDDNDRATNLTTGTFSLSIDVDRTLHPAPGISSALPTPAAPLPEEIEVTMSANAGNYSHTWESFTKMPVTDRYFSGGYTISAVSRYRAEGFDSPYYEGEMKVNVEEGRHTEATLTLKLMSTVSEIIFDPSLTGYFTDVSAYLHSEGNGYLSYTPADEGLLYLNPGTTFLTLHLTLPDGRQAGVHLFTIDDALSGCFYKYELRLDFDGDTPVITATLGEETRSIALSEEFLSDAPPSVAAQGWTPSNTLLLPEGDAPATPVKALVHSAAPLKYLYLSANSPSLSAKGFPDQINLLDLTTEQEVKIRDMGLDWTGTPEDIAIDFTSLLGGLTYLTASQSLSVFGISPVDIYDRVGEPLMLKVETTPVAMRIASLDKVLVGASVASLIVACDVADFQQNVAVELLAFDEGYISTPVTAVEKISEGKYRISFEIPEGSYPIEGRIIYCDTPRVSFTLRRTMPDFSIVIDPFTTYAMLKIVASDQATVTLVTEMLYPYIGGEKVRVVSRNPQRGLLAISGLEAERTYTLTATMMQHPEEGDFTSPLKFTTEGVRALPNPDFEERRQGPSYNDLPSGGRYSQTVVAIFNWQNHCNIKTEVPEGWATTNSKTFCTASNVHNTWYMQPGVWTVKGDTYSGNFSVTLRSAGYDPHGEEIPDYTQTGEPYLNYSPIVPHIRYRAAARLFLGRYSFDASSMEERYEDIVPWSCRPVSLNGYYKYTPSADTPSDAGIALVEVYGNVDGKVSVIGSGKALLTEANSYSPFSAEIEYYYFGVKATGLRVVFASSEHIGTIAEESARVPVVLDIPAAAALGSALSLDHVNLSY